MGTQEREDTMTSDIEMLEMIADRLGEIMIGLQAADQDDPRPANRKIQANMTATAAFAAIGVLKAAGINDESGELALWLGQVGLKAMIDEARSLVVLRN